MGNWEKPFDTNELSENLEKFSFFLDSETIKEKYVGSYSYKRLSQAVKYASELLLCFKPELAPFFALEKLQKAVKGLIAISLEDNFSLESANKHIDVVLNILPRFIEVKLKNKGELLATKAEIAEFSRSKKADIDSLAVAANSALEKIIKAKRDIIDGDGETTSYLAEIEQADEQIKQYQMDIVEIHEKFTEAKKYCGEIQSFHEKAAEAKKDIIDGDEETESYLDEIKQANEEIKSVHEEARKFYDVLTLTDDKRTSIRDAIKKVKDECDANAEKIKQDRAEASDSRKDIDAYYINLFGKENSEGGRVGGIKADIDENVEKIGSLFKEYKAKAESSFKEIESLLPGATSAGLANSYKERVDVCKKSKRWYSLAFYISVVGLLSVICWYGPIHGVTKEDIFYNLLWKCILIAPLIWIATFSSNRANEMTRLTEEYAHKKALAQSYYGFKTQIDALKEKDSVLMKKLLEAAVSSLAYNASDSLEKAKKENHPILSLLEKAKRTKDTKVQKSDVPEK